MKIKIANVEDAKNDASVILECANSFKSLVDTMFSIRSSININWSDCQSKFSAINNLSKCSYYYTYKIIPALQKLGAAINEYVLTTQQLSSNSTLESATSTSNSSSSSIANEVESGGSFATSSSSSIGNAVGSVVSFATLSSSLADNAIYSNNVNNGLDVSVYRSNSTLGFNVTTNNRTYSLPANEFDEFCSIVAAEGDKSYDDSLAVATTILNRCESPEWSWAGGSNPLKQAKYPGQFVVVEEGLNKQYLNGNYPDTVRKAVSDALSGVRNHDYLSFRSKESYTYSNNQITPDGNRYK